MALRSPSGVQRGIRKQLKPFGACASTRNASLHRRRHEPFVAMKAEDCRRRTARARVVLVRRSEPPWFSVMPMPTRAEVFQIVPAESCGRSRARRFAAAIRPRLPAHGAMSAPSRKSSRAGNRRRFRSARA